MSKRRHQEEAAAASLMASKQHSRLSKDTEDPVAVSVDAFLPPSAHAIPSKLSSGASFPALSFGSTNPAQTTNPVAAVIETNVEDGKTWEDTSVQSAGGKSKKPWGRFTEKERTWTEEALKVEQVFGSMYKEAERRQRDNPATSHTTRVQQDSAAKTLESVEMDMQRLVNAMKKSEADTIAYLDSSQQSDKVRRRQNDAASRRPYDTSSDPDEKFLRCNEVLGTQTQTETEPSDTFVRELTIFLAQDTALLRELTSIIRQKTIAMAQKRLRKDNS